MKKIFFTTLSVFFYFIGFSQLTYVDLIYVQKSDLETSDTYLSGKNFQYFETIDNRLTWTQNRDVITNLSSRFISKFCPEKKCVEFLMYVISDPKEYNSLKSEFKKYGYKLIDNPKDKEYMEKNGGLSSTYSNGTKRVNFQSFLSDNNSNSYLITLFPKL